MKYFMVILTLAYILAALFFPAEWVPAEWYGRAGLALVAVLLIVGLEVSDHGN